MGGGEHFFYHHLEPIFSIFLHIFIILFLRPQFALSISDTERKISMDDKLMENNVKIKITT